MIAGSGPLDGDTIFARASGAGKAGIAVFRLSGPTAHRAAELLSGQTPEPRAAAWARVRDPASGAVVDEGLLILFRGPASFTGEDVAELHLHGSRAVEDALYDVLRRLGLRPAEPGEFTRRALRNGKLDLAQVEGLADLIDAETRLQHQQALGQFGGRLSGRAEAWRARLIAISAALEGAIDFPDEADVPATVGARAVPEIEALIKALEAAVMDSARGARLRDGVSVVLLGAPNAGKSSLLNALAGTEKAIVAPTPGTTRDVVEAQFDLGGIAVSLFDTAGLREAAGDVVEEEGMRRALAKAASADVRSFVLDWSDPDAAALAAEVVETGGVGATKYDFVILNKCDLVPQKDNPYKEINFVFNVSALTGSGIDGFAAALADKARDLAGPASDAPLTRARHKDLAVRALDRLKSARGVVQSHPELAGEDVRLAARALGEITGVVAVDDVLEEIFSSFCIGK